MNKRILQLMAILLVSSQIMAGPVDQATARRVGQSFAQTTFNTPLRSEAMNLVAATDAYYVFNIGQTGFVIISANDSFRPVVGYSDEGTLY